MTYDKRFQREPYDRIWDDFRRTRGLETSVCNGASAGWIVSYLDSALSASIAAAPRSSMLHMIWAGWLSPPLPCLPLLRWKHGVAWIFVVGVGAEILQ